MLAVLSPAKKLDFERECRFRATAPSLLRHTRELADVTATLSATEIGRLMKLSATLAELNFERFQEFKASPRPFGARPACYAFDGDTYTGLRATEFDEQEMTFAQQHVGILSGLYGYLRPLDAILPYRLEMGTRLATPRGDSLYAFWANHIAKHINSRLKAIKSDCLINLASQEYFGAVDLDTLKARVITPTFMEQRGSQTKIISFSAKRARGAMARYIVQHRLTDPDDLKDFDLDGYKYIPQKSTEAKWLFVRRGK